MTDPGTCQGKYSDDQVQAPEPHLIEYDGDRDGGDRMTVDDTDCPNPYIVVTC